MQPPFQHDLWRRGKGVGAEIPGAKRGWIHASQASIAGVGEIKLEVALKPFTAFQLRETQESGRVFALERYGSINADPPRMGKTGLATSIMDPDEGPIWIFAPLMTQPVWQRWVKKTLGIELTLVAETGELGLVNFINYENVAKFRALLQAHPASLMIVDEAHRLANARSAKAAMAVAILSRFARRRLLLTGTPIRGRLITLWALLATASPGAWGSLHEFGVRYCGGIGGEHGWRYPGLSNVDELKERLRAVMLRRKRATADGFVDRKLHQVVVDVLRWPNLRAKRAGIQDLAAYRKDLGFAKLEQSQDFLRSLVNPIVWVWHKEVGKLVQNKLKGSFIHGELPLKKRLAVIEGWNMDGGPLIATLPSAQEGIDLSAHESPVVFLELDYVPASLAQAEMRPFKPGQNVDCTYVVDAVCDALVSSHVAAKVRAEDAVLEDSLLPVGLFEESAEEEILDVGAWLDNAWDRELMI
jgi:hypothetical protein